MYYCSGVSFVIGPRVNIAVTVQAHAFWACELLLALFRMLLNLGILTLF